MACRWKKGTLLRIQLDHGREAIAQMLEQPEMAFFHPDNREEVLFRLWVMRSSYTKGRWKRIGEAIVPAALEVSVPRFKVDPISGAVSIYQDDVERPAKPEECEGLECALVQRIGHIAVIYRAADKPVIKLP